MKEGDVLEVLETRQIERTDLDARRPTPAPPSRRLAAHAMGAGYVGILIGRAALPRGGVAEGQAQARASPAKAQLQNRFGASVAEVDHHELWQRSR